MNPISTLTLLAATLFPTYSNSWDKNGLPKKQPREHYQPIITSRIFDPLPEDPKPNHFHVDPFVNHALHGVSGNRVKLVNTRTGQVFSYTLGQPHLQTGITITTIFKGRSWIETMVQATDEVITVAMGYDTEYLARRKKPEVYKPKKKRPVYWIIPEIIVEKPEK